MVGVASYSVEDDDEILPNVNENNKTNLEDYELEKGVPSQDDNYKHKNTNPPVKPNKQEAELEEIIRKINMTIGKKSRRSSLSEKNTQNLWEVDEQGEPDTGTYPMEEGFRNSMPHSTVSNVSPKRSQKSSKEIHSTSELNTLNGNQESDSDLNDDRKFPYNKVKPCIVNMVQVSKEGNEFDLPERLEKILAMLNATIKSTKSRQPPNASEEGKEDAAAFSLATHNSETPPFSRKPSKKDTQQRVSSSSELPVKEVCSYDDKSSSSLSPIHTAAGSLREIVDSLIGNVTNLQQTSDTDLAQEPEVEQLYPELKEEDAETPPPRARDDGDIYDRWKRNCEEGVYTLQSLLDVCERDPDSILNKLKLMPGVSRKLPDGSVIINEPEPFYQLKDIVGEEFGDPKYHYLMVDSSTSVNKMDKKLDGKTIIEPKESLLKAVPHQVKSVIVPYDDEDDTDEIYKQLGAVDQLIPEKESKERKSSTEPSDQDDQPEESSKDVDQQTSEQEESPVEQAPEPEPTKPIVDFIPSEISDKVSEHSEQSTEEEEEEPVEEEEQRAKRITPLQKKPDDKLDTPKSKLLFKKDPGDIGDDKAKYKRASVVSWRQMNEPSDTDSNTSLDRVVKNATAKAESFRQNLDTRKQHSLLDMVKQNETPYEPIEEPVLSPPPNKKKKFFNFKCFDKKKDKRKRDESQSLGSETEEDSVRDELEDRKNFQGSSQYLDSYKRRNTSIVGNPVFEKNKELNTFLDNI